MKSVLMRETAFNGEIALENGNEESLRPQTTSLARPEIYQIPYIIIVSHRYVFIKRPKFNVANEVFQILLRLQNVGG